MWGLLLYTDADPVDKVRTIINGIALDNSHLHAKGMNHLYDFQINFFGLAWS